MPPKDDGISTDLAIKIGEIIGKLDQLIKTVDESKVQTNARIEHIEEVQRDHSDKLAQRAVHVPIFEDLIKRVDALEEKADLVTGGAKGVGLVGSVLKDYAVPFAIGVLGIFGGHYVWEKHDEQTVKAAVAAAPVNVTPPAVIVQQPSKS